jgi:hypothetical protein
MRRPLGMLLTVLTVFSEVDGCLSLAIPPIVPANVKIRLQSRIKQLELE